MKFSTIQQRSFIFSNDRISITKEGDQVVTKYGNRVIKVANVSNRYEIFDNI
jgi:hypothetical protein